MGFDINVHDQWAVESQGPIHDRTREYLGTSDRIIVAYRRMLLEAIDQARRGERPLMVLDGAQAQRVRGPVTIDGIGPAGDWQRYWREYDGARRRRSAWAARRCPIRSRADPPPMSFVDRFGLWTDAPARGGAVARRASSRARGVEVIRFSFPDQHGILRGKTVTAAEFAEGARGRRHLHHDAVRQGHLAQDGVPGVHRAAAASGWTRWRAAPTR